MILRGQSMGKFLEKFKAGANRADEFVNKAVEQQRNKPKEFRGGKIKEKQYEKIGESAYDDTEFNDDYDDKYDDYNDDYNDDYGDGAGIQPAQKPESFHHFILENQYKDLERSIRGFKDVLNKQTQQWDTKRKEDHCFTDEEAEEILRTAQSHLATDIKLSFINMDVFGLHMMAIYKQLDHLFYSISEYRYGRYGSYENQYKMKLQNRKIFLELWSRVQANYSRAIQGAENKATHNSVRGQESLQQTDRLEDRNRRYS